ncbi:uncharacterized protein LOC133929907 [Phragmites australis]|uniref:uncharacterized protein LOC133929907 n=1 Tax=Phragmites australis TaxID=29695 RepID=UPI002D79ED23|nr:uncharacterized protein LOC133929907 [Phragmites australis]
MLGRRRGGSSSKSHEPIDTGAATDNDQGATVSQFITRLDESATKRLQRLNQRLRLLEQQMETLEIGVANAAGDSYE